MENTNTAAPVSAEQPSLLTDEQIIAVWQGMPGGPEGWLKHFGYLQFARAIERAAIAAHLASQSQAAQPSGSRDVFEAQARQAGHINFMRMAGDPDAYDDLVLRAEYRGWCAAHLAVQSQAALVAEAVPEGQKMVDMLLRAMDKAGLQEGELRGHLLGFFCNEWNRFIATPTAQAVTQQAAKAETVEQASEDVVEGLEILDSFMANIENDGNYSAEATLTFLSQIRQCFAPTTSTVSAPDEVRNQALEEAAKQCEDIYSWRGAFSAGLLHTNCLNACAAAIRALRTTNKGEAA